MVDFGLNLCGERHLFSQTKQSLKQDGARIVSDTKQQIKIMVTFNQTPFLTFLVMLSALTYASPAAKSRARNERRFLLSE
jgi:hypothetical protein